MRTISIAGISTPLSRLCLGTGSFGSAIPTEQSVALLDAFAAAGGTFLDSAHIYAAWLPNGTGASERTIGGWLRSRGMESSMAVATKGGHPLLETPQVGRLRPDDLLSDLGESLERLQLPSVDLYWLHRDDPSVPVAEILAVLADLQRAGRIRAAGASNWSTARLDEAAAVARQRRWPGFVASQIGWSLAGAVVERIPPGGMLFMDAATERWHRASGMPVHAYSSQANGYFSKESPPALYDSPANRTRKLQAERLAARHGTTANAIALSWLLDHSCAGAAIVGSRTLAQLQDSIAGERLRLPAADWETLS